MLLSVLGGPTLQTDIEMSHPERVLLEAAALIEKMDVTAGACARTTDGVVCSPASVDASSFCVSGAIRKVTGFIDDSQVGPEREIYFAATDLFCRRVGSETVMGWMDVGRSKEEVLTALRFVEYRPVPAVSPADAPLIRSTDIGMWSDPAWERIAESAEKASAPGAGRPREGAALSAPKHTPGPWAWFGNTKHHTLYLATISGGRRYVIDFARWGMGGAKPRFQVKTEGGGVMVGVEELVEYEVDYRKDVIGVDHPDARLIASAPLLADALEALLATLAMEVDVHQEGDRLLCGICAGLGAGTDAATIEHLPEMACGRARAALAAARGTKEGT
jgi:hypothetical protein